jgi:hypothetical protein
MLARLWRAMFLLFFAVMLAAYAVTAANSSAPDDVHDSFQVAGDQWC